MVTALQLPENLEGVLAGIPTNGRSTHETARIVDVSGLFLDRSNTSAKKRRISLSEQEKNDIRAGLIEAGAFGNNIYNRLTRYSRESGFDLETQTADLLQYAFNKQIAWVDKLYMMDLLLTKYMPAIKTDKELNLVRKLQHELDSRYETGYLGRIARKKDERGEKITKIENRVFDLLETRICEYEWTKRYDAEQARKEPVKLVPESVKIPIKYAESTPVDVPVKVAAKTQEPFIFYDGKRVSNIADLVPKAKTGIMAKAKHAYIANCTKTYLLEGTAEHIEKMINTSYKGVRSLDITSIVQKSNGYLSVTFKPRERDTHATIRSLGITSDAYEKCFSV